MKPVASIREKSQTKMNTMTNWKGIGTAVVGALLIVGALADCITISQFDFHLWEPLGIGISSDQSVVQEPKGPVSSATATPTPVPPLDRQLDEALSVDITSSQNSALFIVAQDAVLAKDYWTAIRAASATATNSAQAKSLAFVVRCAIEDGLYDLAAEAAGEIRITSDRDEAKIEVIKARRWEATGVVPSHLGRESMACFGDESE